MLIALQNDKDKTIVGPYKFSYKELQKQGVIVDSEVPVMRCRIPLLSLLFPSTHSLDHYSRKKTTFSISSEEVGVFDITAKIAGINVEKMTLELDDLLERHYNGVEYLALDQVTLDVNMTIHLINKFLKK